MQLNYKEYGNGKPLIILHGLLGMLDNWQAQARLFEDRFHVFTIDLRNHGHSPHDDTHSYDAMVSDVIELMDKLGLEKAHILGHSMGGKVAIKLAQLHPDRVDKLIVADIGPKFYPVHHQDVLAALKAVPLDKLERRTDAEQYMDPHLKEASVRQFLMKSLYRPERNAFAWRFNLEAIEDQIEHVGEALTDHDYDGETLFIRGGNSDYVHDDDWVDIKLIFPNAFLETVESAGHWLHAEQPQAFAEAVISFLE
ncbi:MAG: alpha/beta fold hydrolase [Salibacteraceae bacterium]